MSWYLIEALVLKDKKLVLIGRSLLDGARSSGYDWDEVFEDFRKKVDAIEGKTKK